MDTKGWIYATINVGSAEKIRVVRFLRNLRRAINGDTGSLRENIDLATAMMADPQLVTFIYLPEPVYLLAKDAASFRGISINRASEETVNAIKTLTRPL